MWRDQLNENIRIEFLNVGRRNQSIPTNISIFLLLTFTLTHEILTSGFIYNLAGHFDVTSSALVCCRNI